MEKYQQSMVNEHKRGNADRCYEQKEDGGSLWSSASLKPSIIGAALFLRHYLNSQIMKKMKGENLLRSIPHIKYEVKGKAKC